MQIERNKAHLITGFFACCLPVVLAAYWPLFALNADLAALVLRPIMLPSAIVLGVCLIGMPITRAEVGLLKVLGLMSLVLLATSLAADNIGQALVEWVKLILMQIYAVMLARALRDEGVARVLGRWMLFSSVAVAGFILYVYVREMGLTLPTYTALRVMKGAAAKAHMPLNPISGCAILSFICAACLLPRKRGVWICGAIVFVAAGFLTGSRASFAVPVAAALVMMLFIWTRSKKPSRAIAGWLLLLGCLAFAEYEYLTMNQATMAKVTEGRSEVWTVALAKFSERPLFGYGYLSWKDDLVSRLPGEYDMTHELAHNVAGGYHNEFLTALAEQGTIGFLAVITLFWLLFSYAKRLSFQPCYRTSCGRMALFLAFFLTLRACVEIDGLFGGNQSPYDFLAYAGLAITVSRMSIEETYSASVAEDRHARYVDEIRRMIQRSKRKPVAGAAGIAAGKNV